MSKIKALTEEVDSMATKIIDRLERENEQLRTDKQELMDALGPFVTGAWVPLQTLQFAKATYDKHYESMT